MTTRRLILTVLAAALAAAAAAIGGYELADTSTTTTTTPAATLTVPGAPSTPAVIAVDGPDADTKRDDALPLSPAAVTELEKATTATELPGDTHTELADPLRDAGPVVTNEGPLAAQETPGCRTRFVRNSSSRNGQAPQVIVWHQTVSRDTPGGADQDGLTAMANRASSGVSWHYLIGGADGRCTYTVPLNLKAWTQANANPFSVGIEVQRFGDEPRYVEAAGRAKLLAVTRYIAKRYGIPLRRGKVVNCRVVKAGVIMHRDLGQCGGGHIDVTATGAGAGARAGGWDIGPLIAELAGGGCSRACDLRKRNRATHTELARRHCAKIDRTRSARCLTLHRRHRELHKAARREKIAL